MRKYLNLTTLGWFILIIVTAALANSGFSKIMLDEKMVQNFEYMKLSPYIFHVGIAELVAVFLLLIPRTSIIGVLMITSLMSAAAAVHLSTMNGENILIPISIGLLTWTGHCLRKYYH